MKAKNASIKRATSLSMAIALVGSVLLYSCKRNTPDFVCTDHAMQTAAKILDGQTLTGSVSCEGDGQNLALNYNNGSKFIIIDKLPHGEPIAVNTMGSVQMITSNYGIIIRDISRNWVFCLMNNDPESQEKFQRIKTLFGNSYQSAAIFGTTIINADRS